MDFIRRVIVLNEGQVVNIKIILKRILCLYWVSLFFIISHVIGYFIAKTKWRIRHLAALSFISTFIIVWLGFYYYFILKEDMSNFCGWKDIFELASSRFIFVAGMSSTLLTLLLVIVVWSIRNKVF